MAQKLLTPFKKLPQQIQNLQIFQKLQDLSTGKHKDILGCHNASAYGIMEHPICLAYDQDLGLLAVAYAHGQLEIYGAPGLSFPVDCTVDGVQFIEFLRNEGRILIGTSSALVIAELNATSGHWEKKSSVDLPFSSEEKMTAVAVGRGVVYVGSSAGTLRQVAVHSGQMTVGDDDLTSLSCHLILNKLADDKREQMHLESAIVTIELHPRGDKLLIGYSGGTVAVAKPQAIPEATPEVAQSSPPIAATDDKKEATLAEVPQPQPPSSSEEPPAQLDAERAEHVDAVAPPTPAKEPRKSRTGERHMAANLQAIRTEATKKFRTLSKTLKSKIEKADVKPDQPALPVPPSPRVLCLLPYTQGLCCATWRVTVADLDATLPQDHFEVLVAYDDGAHLTWKIPGSIPGTVESDLEIAITINQDVACIPYGPIPCCAIQRILARPSAVHTGAMITVFSGGLPRTQHADKHTVSVLGGPEEHTCFQFGSPVCDFILLPPKSSKFDAEKSQEKEEHTDVSDGTVVEEEVVVHHVTEPSQPTEAGYLLVLTERELVAIDLTQSSWTVIPSPYLRHLDCSTVTAMDHATVPAELVCRIRGGDAGRLFDTWPVRGGELAAAASPNGPHHPLDVVAMGHANSIVSLWSLARGDCFQCLGYIHPLSMLDTSAINTHTGKKTEEEAWPPFRHVGDCDINNHHHTGSTAPAELDARCAVHYLSMQLVDTELVIFIGGSSGNLTMWSSIDGAISTELIEPDVAKIAVDLLEDSTLDQFVWEGPPALKTLEGAFKRCPGTCSAFALSELVQFNPPSAITAVAYEPKWGALALGSSHGFALIDLDTRTVVYKKLTLGQSACPTPAGVAPPPSAAGAAASKVVASGRQLKNTLRDSFRKLRKNRSQPAGDAVAAAGDGHHPPTDAKEGGQGEVEQTASEVVGEVLTAAASGEEAAEEGAAPAKPQRDDKEQEAVEPKQVTIEEQVVAVVDPPTALKSSDTTLGVSAILLADTYIIPGHPALPKEGKPAFAAPRTASLIVGTQAGAVLAHTLAWSAANDDGVLTPIEVNFVKEVAFKHAAPVLALRVVDSNACAPVACTEKLRSIAQAIPVPCCEVPAEVPQPTEATDKAPKAEPEVTTESPTDTEAPPPQETVEEATATPVKPAAAAAAPPSPDCHELLVCTEEQVRLVSLPSLVRTKHKYRVFFEQLPSTASFVGGLIAKATPNRPAAAAAGLATKKAEEEETRQEEITREDEPGAQDNAPQAEETETQKPDELEQRSASVDEVARSTDPEKCAPQSAGALRRIAAFSVCQMPGCGDAWHVVLATRNGRINVLALPTLRRLLKASICEHDECTAKLNTRVPCVASNAANLVFCLLTPGVMVAMEMSALPPCRLMSPVEGLKGETYCVCLPEWARPKPPPVAEDSAPEVADDGSKEMVPLEAEGTIPKEPATPEAASTGETAKEVNDITKAITKDLLADGGTVTVMTTESSLEKHTVIEGGNVVTTVHEMERVDGEVTKDDTVQVKSSSVEGASDDVENMKQKSPSLAGTA